MFLLLWCTHLMILLSSNLENFIRSILYTVPVWAWIGFTCIVLMFLSYQFIFKRKKYSSQETASNIQDPSTKKIVDVGWYLSGYPGSEKQIKPCVIYSEDGQLCICPKNGEVISSGQLNSIIPSKCVSNILVEDAVKFKYNAINLDEIPPKEFLLYLDDKLEHEKESELAFLMIKWKLNLEEYCTSFCIDGEMAMERAIFTRNALKKMCKKESIVSIEV